jgi:hypothetical protein
MESRRRPADDADVSISAETLRGLKNPPRQRPHVHGGIYRLYRTPLGEASRKTTTKTRLAYDTKTKRIFDSEDEFLTSSWMARPPGLVEQ